MGSGPSEAPAPFPAERPGRDDEGKGVSRGSAAGTGGAPVRRMPFRAAPGAGHGSKYAGDRKTEGP